MALEVQLYWTRFTRAEWETMDVSQWDAFLVNPTPVGAPIEAVAAHLGQGVVQLNILTPLPAEFRRYEVWTAPVLEGPYEKFANRFLYEQVGFLYGYLIGTTVYLQIRTEFHNGIYGSWFQVKAGNPRYTQAIMLLEAPAGSVIPQGALFTAKQTNQRIAGFTADNEIQF